MLSSQLLFQNCNGVIVTVCATPMVNVTHRLTRQKNHDDKMRCTFHLAALKLSNVLVAVWSLALFLVFPALQHDEGRMSNARKCGSYQGNMFHFRIEQDIIITLPFNDCSNRSSDVGDFEGDHHLNDAPTRCHSEKLSCYVISSALF